PADPSDDDGGEAAAAVVREYYAAIAARDYARAYRTLGRRRRREREELRTVPRRFRADRSRDRDGRCTRSRRGRRGLALRERARRGPRDHHRWRHAVLPRDIHAAPRRRPGRNRGATTLAHRLCGHAAVRRISGTGRGNGGWR